MTAVFRAERISATQVLFDTGELVRPALREAVGGLHPWLAEMAAYSFGWCEGTEAGGKGVRQALAVLGARAAGADAGAGVPGAVAVELVHAFSLLHDDVMDGDATRRGRPALWKAYGTGPAVLAGDALFALAVGILADVPGGVRLLSGALADVMRGQADDLLFAARPWTGPEAVTPEEYRVMAEGKTGALLGCSLALGALLGGAPRPVVAALDRAGRHAGVAFQLADDVLGIWGRPETTGKPVGGDLREGKKTYPVLTALAAPEGARLGDLLRRHRTAEAAALIEASGGRAAALSEARAHLAAARTLLDGLPLEPGAAAGLGALLDALADRER